jgi:hypothetical protein
MTKHITVVYTVEDDESFRVKFDEIMDSMKKFDPENPGPWGVSAVSRDNEFMRIEKIEQALMSFENDDLVDKIKQYLEESPVMPLEEPQ